MKVKVKRHTRKGKNKASVVKNHVRKKSNFRRGHHPNSRKNLTHFPGKPLDNTPLPPKPNKPPKPIPSKYKKRKPVKSLDKHHPGLRDALKNASATVKNSLTNNAHKFGIDKI